MASIEEDLLRWVQKQPPWQANLLKRIVRGEATDAEYIAEVAAKLAGNSVEEEEPGLAASDFQAGGSSTVPIRLSSIGNTVNINALLEGQSLTFGSEGITVVYGDNGSGKSGYARILKDAFGARHREDVLPNAFHVGGADQCAEIAFSVSGEEKLASWPDGDNGELGHGHFYDEACGDDYLEHDTALAYRPSVLTVLDRLATGIDEVRKAVGVLVSEVATTGFVRPDVPVGSTADALLNALSGSTKSAEVAVALKVGPTADGDLAKLREEEARLRATDPSREKKRLSDGGAAVEALANHLENLEELLGEGAATRLLKLRGQAATLREAADAASASSFADEALPGIGGDAWRVLWTAAEQYSATSAYPNEEFPAADVGHRCVLCQQELDGDARSRLRRFHEFVADEVARKAKKAETDFAAAIGATESLQVSDQVTSVALRFLEAEDEDSALVVDLALTQAELARHRVLDRARDVSTEEFIELLEIDIDHLRDLSKSATERADKTDDVEFTAKLQSAETARAELEGCVNAAKHRKEIEAEISRRAEENMLRELQVGISTQATTTFTKKLASKYVTEKVKETFAVEAKRLRLEHVALGDRPGSKAQVNHRPTLEGAGGRTPREVLSEGEQTAAGLAGLFTELVLDESKSVVVLDDPVTSLDHDRRAIVAARLVEFASDRQVVVFTHDLVLLGELSKIARNRKTECHERSVVRTGDGTPGRVEGAFPWNAKDAKQRIHELSLELAQIKMNSSSMTQDQFNDAAALWAGRLSQLWERIVRSEIAYRVIDRSTNEVRPELFRVIESVSATDGQDFREGYKAASDWAPRHDSAEEANRPTPTVTELEAELVRIEGFFGRVRKYAQ